jgi:formylglycine-generating enzyme
MGCSAETSAERPRKACCCPAASHAGPASLRCLHESTSPEGTDRTKRAMASIAGGSFAMGSAHGEGYPDDGESPVRTISLDPFLMDVSPVTNEDFRFFVDETRYKTEAEVFGWSFVFWNQIPPRRFRALVQDTVPGAMWWCRVEGACWRCPEGPGSHLRDRGRHPVVHVSWNDAVAYAAWCGRRLPTEAEWEYAARGGLSNARYPWGDDLTPNGKHLCNIWQGTFPTRDTAEDGFAGTCPVDAFPPNGCGLYSVTGNTWEWCADWFTAAEERGGLHNPKGPHDGYARVMKGGSFLCHESYCNRYRVGARTSNTPDSSTSHVGFRCAKSLHSGAD